MLVVYVTFCGETAIRRAGVCVAWCVAGTPGRHTWHAQGRNVASVCAAIASVCEEKVYREVSLAGETTGWEGV